MTNPALISSAQSSPVGDAGKVRLGAMAPALKPATIADPPTVRLGAMPPNTRD